MRSMTGFGQAGGENDRFRVTVTLRGVNHRFLDLSLRLRDEYRAAEADLREVLTGQLERGRVEVTVDIEPLVSRPVKLQVDHELALAVRQATDSLAAEGLIGAELSLGDLMRLPEVVRLRVRPLEWRDADQELLLTIAGRALVQLVEARATEGQDLGSVLDQRLQALTGLTAELAQRAAKSPIEAAAALRKRIDELLAGEAVDENRLAQEIALLVDKSDVSEELDRLRSHLKHFSSLLQRPGAVGKRLEFLTQEVLRELNTVGSKCRDSEMTRRVLEGKALCEQVREQVQNVE